MSGHASLEIWVHASAPKDEARYREQAHNILQFLNGPIQPCSSDARAKAGPQDGSVALFSDNPNVRSNLKGAYRPQSKTVSYHDQAIQADPSSTIPDASQRSFTHAGLLGNGSLDQIPGTRVTQSNRSSPIAINVTPLRNPSPTCFNSCMEKEVIVRTSPKILTDNAVATYFSKLMKESQVSACFKPKWIHPEMSSSEGRYDRAHWRLCVPVNWPHSAVDKLWMFLRTCIVSGRAGPATWMERTNIPQSGHPTQRQDLGLQTEHSGEIWKIHGYRRLCQAHWALLYIGTNGLVYSQSHCLSYHDQVSGRSLIELRG